MKDIEHTRNMISIFNFLSVQKKKKHKFTHNLKL